MQVAGDLEAEFTSELAAPAIYSPPPGTLVLRWVGGPNGVGITGPTFTGTPADLGRARAHRLARHGTWNGVLHLREG
ncbi:MAG: hypothetical protein ACRDHS_10965 [Actinomycetota bacterium]